VIVNLIIGALAAACVCLIVNYAKKRRLPLKWWQWSATISCVLYSVFVLELICGFLHEGNLKGAVVNGMLTGIVAVVWGVLIARKVLAEQRY
jgi:hypothetical protein